MDYLALADFNLVAAHGGVGSASRASKRPKATLSRHLLELEQALGVRLVERGPRSMRLTEEGQLLHARTRDLLSEIDAAAAAVSSGLSEPQGVLRISAPLLFAHSVLGRIAAGFTAAHPKVLLDIRVDNRLVDLVEEGFDLVIRANPPPKDDLVGRCVMRDRMLIVAPPDLPRPADPEAGVPAVVLADTPGDKLGFTSGAATGRLTPRPVLRLASMLMIRDAACSGAGVALLPRSVVDMALSDGRLVCWGESAEPDVEIWALHTSRRLVSSKVRAFLDFLSRELPASVAPRPTPPHTSR